MTEISPKLTQKEIQIDTIGPAKVKKVGKKVTKTKKGETKKVPTPSVAVDPKEFSAFEESVYKGVDAKWLSLIKEYLAENRDNNPFKNVFIEKQSGVTIYPRIENILNAFRLTAFDETKCVILGQDPYHAEGQAIGLSFSLPNLNEPTNAALKIKMPPSLRRIYNELGVEKDTPLYNSCCLTSWADQGVLLLNTILTVKKSSPMSHQDMGWKELASFLIKRLCAEAKHKICFLLWGKHAEAYKDMIGNDHHILVAGHPSPLAMGAEVPFIGCRHFERTNELLVEQQLEPINWKLLPKSKSAQKSIMQIFQAHACETKNSEEMNRVSPDSASTLPTLETTDELQQYGCAQLIADKIAHLSQQESKVLENLKDDEWKEERIITSNNDELRHRTCAE